VVKRLVTYIGTDLSFWGDIVDRSQHLYDETAGIKYEHLGDVKKDDYRVIFSKILKALPNIIYVDFSEGTADLCELVIRISDEPLFRNIAVVGLIGEKKSERDSRFAHIGLTSIHVKCAEMNDCLFLPYSKVFPGLVKIPAYARARFQQDCDVGINMRIVYITKDHLHIENNVEWNEGDRIVLETKIPARILPSKRFTVIKRYISNLQFRYKYAYDIKPQFLDPPEFSEEQGDYDRKVKLSEYQADLEKAQREFKSWVFDKSDLYKGNQTKVLIIDSRQDAFDAGFKKLVDYPYTFYCQTHLSRELEEIPRHRPNLIAVHLDDEFIKGEEKESDKDSLKKNEPHKNSKKDDDVIINDVELVTEIIKKMKTLTSYEPAVVLFNSAKYSSKACQDNFKYNFVMSNSGKLNLDLIADFAEMYEKKKTNAFNKAVDAKIQLLKKKEPGKYRKLSMADFIETKYFLRHDNPCSNAVWMSKITVESMTESEVVFVSKVPLEDRVYCMDFPQKLFVSLVPVNKDGRMYEKRGERAMYRAITSYVDEVEKRKLRQFVNGVFFSDLNRRREQEDEQYRKRHEAAAAEKNITKSEQLGEGDQVTEGEFDIDKMEKGGE